MAWLSSVFVVLALLIFSEVWWRNTKVHGEISRKFVHITVGSFVAFWPFFLGWRDIEILSVAFVVGIATSKYLRIFTAIHSVQRPTQGEFFFALAVGCIALITHDKWIYLTALLQMSLADGLAAVVGVAYGRRSGHKVFGQLKSVAGTATFALVSWATLIIYNHYGHSPLSLLTMLALTLMATLIENAAVFGLDNLLVPLLVAVAMRLL